ncbi:MAG: hypothetical protein QOJ46_1666 [bacterium]|jgi:hypothetical protein
MLRHTYRLLLLGSLLFVAVLSPPATAADPVVSCGNRVYDKEPIFSFTLTRLRAGVKNGHRFVQYQLHIQAYRAFTPNIAYTWLRAAGRAPGGGAAAGYDDSRSKVGRKVHMPWYAHFRITVKPGSVLTYKGYLHLTVPIEVPGGQLTGYNYHGACAAR